MSSSTNQNPLSEWVRQWARALLPLSMRTSIKLRLARRRARADAAAMARSGRRKTRHLRVLRAFYGDAPVPLSYWRRAHRVIGLFAPAVRDPFSLPTDLKESTGAAIQTAELRPLLEDNVLGVWAMCAPTIDRIWRELMSRRPEVIVEFGAGVSTIVLARYAQLRRQQETTGPWIVSIEQSADVKREMEEKLGRLGLDSGIRIVHAPLDERDDYRIAPGALTDALQGRRVDFILIDGPAGPEGCRAQTMPLIQPHCRPGAVWFLDDAYRDGEMSAMRQWQDRGVRVKGVLLLGSGLGVGAVDDPAGHEVEKE